MMKEISPYDVTDNVFKMIGKDWTLVTAGTSESYNTMTASWGSAGIMWNKPVLFTFIRPQRYTFGFMEKNPYYSVSVYPEQYRKALTVCGTKSGRDIDKARETGLTPVFDEDAPYFEQARLVFICRKLYAQELAEEYVVEDFVKGNYNNDYHKMYVGEIVKVLVSE